MRISRRATVVQSYLIIDTRLFLKLIIRATARYVI